MKKQLLTLIAAMMAIMAIAQEQVPAFPGAEGHGRYVTGGRGGQVIHVTNLNDSGSGSLRNAVSGSSKKIIVFDVAGVIALKNNLNIGANTTILGQPAPAPGAESPGQALSDRRRCRCCPASGRSRSKSAWSPPIDP